MLRLFVHQFMVGAIAVVLSPLSGLAQEAKTKSKDLPVPSRTIEYKKVGDKALSLHLFEPSKPANPSATKPASIVFFFGGGWTSGSPNQFYAQAKHLADLGVLAMCADYRVRSRDGVAVVECTADAQDAIAYVRDHAPQLGIDPQRIVAAGGSAGGHLAAACATVNYRGTDKREPAAFRPNALVLFNPALLLGAAADVKLAEKDQAKVEALAARLGDKPESLSPYHQLTKALPPTLILHGKADTTVPFKTVELFAAKAKELGCDCMLVGYEGQQHGFSNYQRNQENYESTRDEMVKFLRKLGFLP